MLVSRISSRRQKGFTLLEIMVALFVLSVGILGSTALLLRGQSEARQQNYDSIAAMLTQNMAERMRRNVQGVNDGHYNALVAADNDPGCITSGCTTTAQIAQYDGYVWWSELNDLLPDGTGRITGNGQNTVFNITVSWTETIRNDNTGTDETTRNYTMVLQP